jgi:hypothetical protein
MDNHLGQWFSSWRSFDVVDDLQLLKAQCRMFDNRLETVIYLPSVPRIFGDHGMPGEVSRMDGRPESERMKSILIQHVVSER